MFTLLMGDGGRKRAIHTVVVSNHHPGVLLIGAGCHRRVRGLQFGDIGASHDRRTQPSLTSISCHREQPTRAISRGRPAPPPILRSGTGRRQTSRPVTG